MLPPPSRTEYESTYFWFVFYCYSINNNATASSTVPKYFSYNSTPYKNIDNARSVFNPNDRHLFYPTSISFTLGGI